MKTAIQVLCDGTIRATLLILMERGIEKDDIDNGLVADVVKAAMKARIDQVLDEWKEATEANYSVAWLWDLMNAQCHEVALEAVAEYERAGQQMRDGLYDAGVGYGR